MDEGVIKYDQSKFVRTAPLPKHEYAVIERYRKILNRADLIGAYESGLGFGNISLRKNYTHLLKTAAPQFIITGTQTGHLPDLGGEHYTMIVDFDLDAFSVTARGSVAASSETATHAAVYKVSPYIKCVIHIHQYEIWKAMIKENYPSTSKWIPYGTYEMAVAVKGLIGDGGQGCLVMKGHEEGVIVYGPNISSAVNLIGGLYRKFIDKGADLS